LDGAFNPLTLTLGMARCRRLFSVTCELDTFGTPVAYSSPLLAAPKPPTATQKGGLTMFAKMTDTTLSNRTGAPGRQLLLSFIASVFVLTISPAKAHAQIVGNIEVNIPFQFHAGNAKLPPGKYVIHMLNDSDLKIMEISSADGSAAALFEVRDAEANSAPAKSELIFNKFGNRYFLSRVFAEDNPSGSAVEESHYEKTVSQKAADAQIHVPARHSASHPS
jgi:hypothetical protein